MTCQDLPEGLPIPPDRGLIAEANLNELALIPEAYLEALETGCIRHPGTFLQQSLIADFLPALPGSVKLKFCFVTTHHRPDEQRHIVSHPILAQKEIVKDGF